MCSWELVACDCVFQMQEHALVYASIGEMGIIRIARAVQSS